MVYTLADLTKITQANRRSVQLWGENEALLALPSTHQAGTGTHRVYEETEAIIACLLHQFARQSVRISLLKKLGRQIRAALKDLQIRAQIDRAIKGHGRNLLLVNRLDGRGKMVLACDADTPQVDLFERLAGVMTDADDTVTHVIDLNKAFRGFRL